MDTNETSDVPKDTSLLLAEYSALRDEIVKRLDVEHQLATFTVFVFGTILGIGFQNNKIAPLILIYPTIALFLSIGWSHSDYMTMLIGTYIKERIEAAMRADNMGWEHFLATTRVSLRYSWDMRGMFISTELIAIVVGVAVAPFNNSFIAVLLICNAIVSLLLTAFFIFRQVPIKPI